LASLGLVYVFDQSNPVRSQSAGELAHTFVTITTDAVTWAFVEQPSQQSAANAQIFYRVKNVWASLRCSRNTPPTMSTDPTIAVTAYVTAAAVGRSMVKRLVPA